MRNIRNTTSLIRLLALYIWIMALGYWSPQLPTEVQTGKGSTWFQLDGRTDGSIHLVPNQYDEGTLESRLTPTDPYPHHHLSFPWLVENSLQSKTPKLYPLTDHVHSWIEQHKADLLYPFHFFF
ncbi:hypothetical protein [Flagellimonas olearia]|uniref:hypothetical protein n=1 Tax=Flagellimonas olearia TaxID=552546 RepID=UPI00126267F8|nr:hypothetical protein [Allomuricauda olearia]